MTCPYRFPARSRAAMIAAMESIGGYSGWNAPRRSAYPFAWNVKIHRFPSSARELEAHNDSGHPFNAEWDSAWESYAESDWFFGSVTEDMAGQVEDYSTWPGDDSGEYKFSFGGRSGGWLILESAFGWDMAGFDFADLADSESYSFAEVRALYRAVTVMESDFSAERVEKEFAYQVAFRRGQWEAERREQIANLTAESAGDKATALRLIGELRTFGATLPAAMCDAIRSAIRNAKRDASDTRLAALALAHGESGE